ncbi:MAG: LptF/LptG family permease [Candidatus Melainabacteria bacterium]|nr:LptF/LptG family permease [Candidatus Melainabacteria bacterium]
MQIAKLLDLHIMREQLHFTYVFILTLLGMFFGTSEIREIIRQIAEMGMPSKTALYIMAMNIPAGIVDCLPAAVLMSALLVLHRMCTDCEIIALQTSGISFFRIISVFLAAGLVCSSVSFLISEYAVPCAQRTTWGLMAANFRNSELPISTGTSCEVQVDFDNAGNVQKRYMFVGKQHHKQLSNITVLASSNGREIDRVMNASHGIYERGNWILSDGRMYNLTDNAQASFATFGQLEIAANRSIAKVYEKSMDDPFQYNTGNLKKYIDAHGGDNAPAYLLIHYYKRYTKPLACFFIILAAAPMALNGRRTRTWQGLAYAGIMLSVYYSLVAAISGLAENGRMLPLLAAWLPNIAVGFLGITILTIKSRQSVL